MNSPETHLVKAGAPERPCDTCGNLFKPKRPWSRFCKTACRNAFHGTEARKAAIRDVAPAMYEALRAILSGPCWEPPHDTGGVAPCPHCIALAAIKDLKAP